MPLTPRHIAIVMDGNGRWANQRGLSRAEGHKAGLEALKMVIKACAQHEIQALTVFAFSTENWRRPASEVRQLFDLFLHALTHDAQSLHENGIRLRFIGDLTAFEPILQEKMREVEQATKHHQQLTLAVAVNYGGHWDIVQATKKIAEAVKAGRLQLDDIDADSMETYLSTHDLPPLDLFIRTSGEQRISNFLNWQLAYSELFFTETLWPDFDDAALQQALEQYAQRERRYGKTSEQLPGVDAC